MRASERRHRLLSAALVLVSGAFVFGTVLLAPSAVALIAARQAGAERLATTRRLAELQKHAGAGEDIALTREKMEILAEDQRATPPHELIERIVPLLPAGVSLQAIAFTRQEGGALLELSGSATSRTALLAFGDALRGSGLFMNVTIPIQSLAQATDLRFRLSLTLSETAVQ